ncbi:DUF1176 domain-containing protein [Paramixta manurensis]|uniref:DUF1176 domain-containing protein n=1 Tax=Paramixta manurensis TaxID=2740817 RepID=A0A6M8UGH7_9GAMM|nr:DUF1176 domain-containing protein [Erwiniaceae bacterium PD-1]
MLRNVLAFLAAGALGVTAPVLAAEPQLNQPVQKLFKDWQVTCNNLNDCDIRNVDENMRVVIKHQAGANGAVSLDIMSFDAPKAEGIWLDGKPWHSDITLSDADDNNDFANAHSEKLSEIQALLQAAKNAMTMTLTADQDVASSLSGLNAALLFVDDRQGRINNQTALFKVGNDEPDSVPPRLTTIPSIHPPAIVALSSPQALIDAVLQSQQTMLKQEECESADNNDTQHNEAQPLDDKNALVMINCVQGAYQSSSLVFITPRAAPQTAKLLTLPLPLVEGQDKPDNVSWFTEVSYDPKTGELFHAARGRGIADCGESAGWRYDGKTFHLISYNSQPSCDGGEPGDWPSIWATPE